jgi:hypothetical protein
LDFTSSKSEESEDFGVNLYLESFSGTGIRVHMDILIHPKDAANLAKTYAALVKGNDELSGSDRVSRLMKSGKSGSVAVRRPCLSWISLPTRMADFFRQTP